MLDFLFLAQQCAPDVHPDTMRRIVRIESSFNPFAIGVVGGRLERQPRNREEAVATAKWLEHNGYNYSVGLTQVNKTNFTKQGLTLDTAFDACQNVRAGGDILKDCFIRAKKFQRDEQGALRDAFSCYYSGNFITGHKLGYVFKVVSGKDRLSLANPTIVLLNKKKNNKNIKSAGLSSTMKTRQDITPPGLYRSALLF